MQTVVVPFEAQEFQAICDECLAEAGRNGAVARLVTGTFHADAATAVALCPVGHRVAAIRIGGSLVGSAA